MPFFQDLLSLQKGINREVARFFNRKIKEATAAHEKEILGWLREYSLRPAKRIRAVLVNYGYFLAGGKDKEAILEASIFIELIHNYLLIHDDIIDKDEMRRGKKSLHSVRGSDVAIVVGDMASALGYEALDSAAFPVKNRAPALAKLNKVLYATGYGQILDLFLREKIKSGKKVNDKEVLDVYKKKTAFYTIVAPLQIGAILAGAGKNFLEKIEKFALPLGMAFQIKDDLQDGDIDKIFGLDRLKYQKMQEKLITVAQRILKEERAFPQKEKEFLLNLAEQLK
ncbi:MAG: polyprenyl synthetase family protein [Patescibacteria group bacterium]